MRTYKPVGIRTLNCSKCGQDFQASRSDAQFCLACRPKREQEKAREKGSRYICPRCNGPMARRAGFCHNCAVETGKYIFSGESNPYWKGGRINHQGYIRIKNPNPYGRPRYIGEHILVWETANGKVPINWNVHHLNGIKDDNRLENLFAMSKSDHHSNHHQYYESRIRELEAQLGKLKPPT